MDRSGYCGDCIPGERLEIKLALGLCFSFAYIWKNR